MDRHFSLYLDLLRISSALLVVLAHFIHQGMVGQASAASLPDLGREAVIIFFVLSGFVIAWSSATRADTLKHYATARCARIYSVAMPVVVTALLFATLGIYFLDLTISSSYQTAKPHIYVPLHLLFLGQSWNIAETPPWVAAYWSLNFEVWYYVLFGVAYYLRGARRILAATCVLALMGHKLWLLLPVWACGAALYHLPKNLLIPCWLARAGWLATIFALFAYKAAAADIFLRALGDAVWPFRSLTLGIADRYLADYLVALIVFLHLLCARHARFSVPAMLGGPIRALASYTFTLYLVHELVMGMWIAFYRHDAASALDIFLLSVAIIAATWAFGSVTEQRKSWFARAFGAISAKQPDARGIV